MELSELQKRIVTAPEERIAVIACAACGKTQVLTERVRFLLKSGINPKDIACITFTNLAAQEMRERLGSDYKDGIYIGTIHGLANYFLLSHGIQTGKLIEEQKFDKFFELIEKNPYCVRHIPYILLDEAQDTSPEEYDFIFKMIQPENFFIVGDDRQSIYGFKGCDPELFLGLIDEPTTTVYSLNENYRNSNSILKFAKKLIHKGNMEDDSIPMRKVNGTVYETEADIKNLRGWIENQGEPGDWAILCNTNEDIKAIRARLDEYGIKSVTFKQGEVDKNQLEALMKENAVKVLTRHSSKGLEFPYVAVWKPQAWGGAEGHRVNYVAATRAKDILLWMREPPKTKKVKSKWF